MADFTSWGVIQAIPGPTVITGYTVENISAGWFVRASESCTADVVTSAGLSSYDPKGDIKIQACDAAADSSFCIGVALEDIPSGSYGSIAMDGVYLFRTGEAVNAGARVEKFIQTNSQNCVGNLSAGADDANTIGVALTSASAAEKFVVVRLRV